MKKKIIILLAGVVLLGALLGVYALSSKNTTEQAENPDDTIVESQSYTLIEKSLEDITSLTIDNGNFLVYLPSDEGFTVSGYEDVYLNQSNVQSVVNTFATLTSSKIVVDNPEDLSVYGLEVPSAVAIAQYSDGSAVTLNLGSITPDNNYYYAVIDGDTNVYLVDSLIGNRILYSISELIDTNISKISSSTVTYIDIKQKGADEILIVYDENNSAANENLQKNGLFTLTMQKPLSNVLVYPYNLQSTILNSLSAIYIKDVVEAAPTDLSQYGLAEPNLVVELKDSSSQLRLTAGNFVNDTDVYVMINDRPEVFLMDKSAVSSFMDVNIIDFIQKFVAIHTRSSVNNISLQSSFGNLDIALKEEGDNKIEQIDGANKDMRNSYINNTLVEREEFTNFYELLAGLGFDAIDQEAVATGEVECTISYGLTSGEIDKIEFYPYNANFYVAKKGENSSMIVSRQSVKQIIDKGLALAN